MKTQQPLLAAMMISATFAVNASAQNFRSPEVHPDGSVTIRLLSATAKRVSVRIAGTEVPLVKGEKNIWEATTRPLPAGIHDYSLDLDGTRIIDPSNRRVKKWFTLASMVEVPGTPPLLTESLNVPHGVVQHRVYDSTSTGRIRPLIVYTPPSYSDSADARYPLIILMHGFGDDEAAWTEVGRAHLIADNLIAQKKIRPCVIAMPYGHPVPPPVGARSERPRNYGADNNKLYERDIMGDLLPFLNRTFRLSDDPDDRSIVGLSMGGGHAIHVGLSNTPEFSCIGAFSAAAPQESVEDLVSMYSSLSGPAPKANQLRSFYIPIGTDDFLLDRNRKFAANLRQLRISHRFVETDGSHSWKVWRTYLPDFLQMAVGVEDSE